MKKRLPYGQSSYNTLVNDNFIYVDKTKYIEKLEKLHDTFVFFL
ncbi:MAG: AAA family ATPase, partial [Clostridium sp.]